MVAEGSWVKDAPKDAVILGLKELPEDDFPLEHVHVTFAHCYKQQGGWENVLSRWHRGKGLLLDLEFLTDESGRRVAAFGFSAGYAGSALAIKNWAWQLTHPEGEPLPGEVPYANQDLLIASVKESVEAGKKVAGHYPKILVIGAVRSSRSLPGSIGTHRFLAGSLWQGCRAIGQGCWCSRVQHHSVGYGRDRQG